MISNSDVVTSLPEKAMAFKEDEGPWTAVSSSRVSQPTQPVTSISTEVSQYGQNLYQVCYNYFLVVLNQQPMQPGNLIKVAC
jgi:hypothetical protein